MGFTEKLVSRWAKSNSLLCIGLDPDIAKLLNGQNQFSFNKAIVDATHDLVCCYKPNSAFYEANGAEGIAQLKQICSYIKQTYPDIPLVLDFKRGDIGNTNQGYAQFAFDYLQADAITVQPYQGREAVQSFLDYKDKGVFVLCRTSNPGAGEFQDLVVNGMPLYEYVGRQVVKEWNKNKNCMLVVGATFPNEAAKLREIVGDDMPLLMPGLGSQGGNVEEAVKAGLNSQGTGLIINSSRETLFASNGTDFAEAARQKATKLRDEINKYRG